jgi:2-polyprenyl-3-methyl-5-hydroxy-6-metoxy-1,4-benzoquinol methylase
MDQQTPANFPEKASESQRIWDAIAPFWDNHMGEANDFQRYLVNPAVESLLELQPGEEVLEIACGNGSFARRMAKAGAHVTAFDFSSVFIERARERTAQMGLEIEYHVMDATDREALKGLGAKRFEAAVCNMAIMDMADIDPLVKTLPELLAPGGRFVFSIQHPCFNLPGMTFVLEEIDRDGELVVQSSVKVGAYLTPISQKGTGVIGQPELHYYFHRPLSVLLSAFFRVGFKLDGLEERAFSGETQPNRPFSWANFTEIPPVMAARLRIN